MQTNYTLLWRLLAVVLVVATLLTPTLALAAPEDGTTQLEGEELDVTGEEPVSPDSAQSVTPTEEAPIPTAAPTEDPAYPGLDVSVLNDDMSAILLDADTGEVLFERKPNEMIYPASTTKIMTALLSIELNGGTLDGEITCGPEVNAFSSTSSLLGLRENATVSIRDLLYGLMLVSGNDAAAALAVHFGGSLEGFVALMNQKAQELGMTGTLFANPHGLDQRSIGLDHHSTAADMAKLARAAYQNEVLMTIMGTGTYTITSTELNPNIRDSPELHNGNYMLETPVKEPQRARYAQFRYEPTTGMKTGLLQNVDGHKYYGCLVASASQHDHNLIACIFADTSDYGAEGPALDRWNTAITLFQYGLTMVVDVDLAGRLPEYETQIKVGNYAKNDPYNGTVTLTPQSDALPTTLGLSRSQASQLEDGSLVIQAVPQIQGDVQAPVTEGQTLGTLSYQINGEEIFSAPLVASRSVYEEGEEQATSTTYNVPVTGLFPWWVWLIIVGGGVGAFFLIYWLVQRRRYSAKHIGKSRKGTAYYNSYMRSWNDDVPLSALRNQRNAKNKPRSTSHYKKW